MRSPQSVNDVSIALERYMHAASVHSDACDAIAHCLDGDRHPTAEQLQWLADSKIVLLAARRAYRDARDA